MLFIGFDNYSDCKIHDSLEKSLNLILNRIESWIIMNSL